MAGDRWVNVAVAAIGAMGMIVAGMIGYANGSDAVEKDYVQIAVNMLDKKDTSPELRAWAVNVLSDLSPVPFGEKLKEELTNKGIYRERFIVRRFEPPAILVKPCPNFLPPKNPSITEKEALRAANEYEKCRIQMDSLIDYISETNAVADQFNAEQLKAENEFRAAVGLDPVKSVP